jgi:replicative DNA helicase
MNYEKGIHHNIEIEAAVLGACLLESSAFGRVYDMLQAEHFYNTGNTEVFATMRFMYENGMQIDLLTVVDYMMRVQGCKMLCGDNTAYFVARLTNYVVSSAHMEYHAHVIKTMWISREIIRLTHGGANLEGDTREQIATLQKTLQSLQEGAIEHDWQDMTQLMVNLYQHQEKMKATGGVGVPTGIKTLDRKNGGFQNGNLIVIGARPSMGKSAFVGGMAIEMGKQAKTVGIISLEMSNNEIAARLASYDTETDFNVCYRGLYKDEAEAHRLHRMIGKSTSTLPIYVSDKTKVNIHEIRAKAEKLKRFQGLDCLIIDYLQLVSSAEGSRNRNRENEISEMSRGAKIMAKEMNIPVVILSQLNREVTKRKGLDRYPQLSDLRESGSLEQDADVVMFIHRDFMMGVTQDENGFSTEKQADLVIRKWRNETANFIIPLDFDGPRM